MSTKQILFSTETSDDNLFAKYGVDSKHFALVVATEQGSTSLPTQLTVSYRCEYLGKSVEFDYYINNCLIGRLYRKGGPRPDEDHLDYVLSTIAEFTLKLALVRDKRIARAIADLNDDYTDHGLVRRDQTIYKPIGDLLVKTVEFLDYPFHFTGATWTDGIHNVPDFAMENTVRLLNLISSRLPMIYPGFNAIDTMRFYVKEVIGSAEQHYFTVLGHKGEQIQGFTLVLYTYPGIDLNANTVDPAVVHLLSNIIK